MRFMNNCPTASTLAVPVPSLEKGEGDIDSISVPVPILEKGEGDID